MTRMWMVNPRILCRNHLLGEHNEIHKALGNMKKGRSIKKYLEQQQLDPREMLWRHNYLVDEMLDRGYNHHSPLSDDDLKAIKDYSNQPITKINPVISIMELSKRCCECKKRIMEVTNNVLEKET